MLFSVSPRPVYLSALLLLNGTTVERVDNYKYLGIVLDSGLSYSEHTRVVIAKARRNLGCVSRTIRKFVHSDVIRRIYVTIILPSLLYASPLSCPVFQKDRMRLERLNKFACRLICNDFNWNHDYQSLLTKARLSPLYRVTCTNRLCLMFKYVKGLRYIPEQFLPFESQRNVVVRRSTRLAVTNNSYTLIIPTVTRDRSQKSVIYIGSQLWNAISDDIINLEYANFRRRVRRNDIFNLLCDKNLVKIINV